VIKDFATQSGKVTACRKIILFFFCLLGLTPLQGQLGGNRLYSFLQIPATSRVSALGGTLVSIADADIGQVMQNPALGSILSDKGISFQHQFFYEGIQTGAVSYGQSIIDSSLFAFIGIQYFGYGQFTETDVFGNEIGEFLGNELAISFGASYQLYDRLRVGMDLKLISSNLDVYHSIGLATDLGLFYQLPESHTSLGLAFKNLGSQLTVYDEGKVSSIVPNLTFGISKRLQHLPFRFNIQFHHLNRWKLVYDNQETEVSDPFFTPIEGEVSGFDRFFRHVNLGGELLLGKKENVQLRLGYNHQKKQELSIVNVSSFNGFSFGLGVNSSKFSFDYALRKFHYAGSAHHIGIRTNLHAFTRTKVAD